MANRPRDFLHHLLPAWLVVAIGRVILAPSRSPISYALLGVLWILSAVLMVMAVRLVIVTESAERRIVALCLSLMMAALLAQGIVGNDDTVPIATAVFFSSLGVLVYFFVRMRRRGAAIWNE